LGDLVGSMDRALPASLIDHGLPRPDDAALAEWIAATPQYRGRKEQLRLVAVCDCGEPGCGSTLRRVVEDGNAVAFRDFLGPGIGALVEREYRFTRANYEAVMAEIAERAREHR